jgi:5-methylcytosine-specific restriction protein B
MGLKDLTTDEIIEVIKRKEASYTSGGYLYFDRIKLSPNEIFNSFGRDYNKSNNDSLPDKNMYAKLLSILNELNKENIYLKTPNKYLKNLDKFGITIEQYNLQLQNLPQEKQSNNKKVYSMEKQHPLNQILYGPPGTGKTYNTINRALEIIDGKIPPTREKARERFNELRKEGQIEFVTFHQSYGYEEFVEGIKADLDSDKIKYKLEEGIFKELCKKSIVEEKNLFTVGQKIGTNEVYSVSNELLTIKRTLGGRGSIPMYLVNEVLSLIVKGIITPQDFKNGKVIDKLDSFSEKSIIQDFKYFFQDLVKYYLNNKDNIKTSVPNYILIIDEINRGNISKIFGELITLIEPSKRLGADEELKLTLPNSKDSFGVPSNLYIIGTMNTADRSIAQIDTALRRRFEFVEMMPEPKLIVDEDEKPIVIDGIKVQEVLKAINERIEYIYDREHTIGHSYFLPLIKEPTKKKLDEIFKVNILPLLAEYFYGDWADIIEVLNNNGFVIKKKLTYTTKTDRGNKIYKINESFEVDDYIKIYDTNEK